MTLEQFYNKKYILPDGEVLSFHFDYDKQVEKLFIPSMAIIMVLARQTLKRDKYRSCKVVITLAQIMEIRIFNEKNISGNYSDITILKLDNGNYYISFDPYGNTNRPNKEDNFVFIAKTLDITEYSELYE